jgi:hypothetical protein
VTRRVVGSVFSFVARIFIRGKPVMIKSEVGKDFRHMKRHRPITTHTLSHDVMLGRGGVQPPPPNPVAIILAADWSRGAEMWGGGCLLSLGNSPPQSSDSSAQRESSPLSPSTAQGGSMFFFLLFGMKIFSPF